jgi:hypothetical protein
MKKQVKQIPFDRKKARKPSAAMQMEAVHLVDEYFAQLIKDHEIGRAHV